jgi:DNA polymerase-1
MMAKRYPGNTRMFSFDTPENWTPDELPTNLGNIQMLGYDTETNGLRWHKSDRPIGLSIYHPDLGKRYFPWGHQGGGNLPEEQVKRWAQDNLRGKTLLGLNIKFDIHMTREWGVNLETIGCKVADVSHYAALLDDQRLKFSLDALTKDYLGREKVGKDLDTKRMADYHASEVAPRAGQDAQDVWDLREKMWPLLESEELHTVRQLEEDIIFAVCEMEKNGAPIDVPLLDKWVVDSEQEMLRLLWKVAKEVGFNVNPDSTGDMERVFEKLGIPILTRTAKGRGSFTDSVLKALDNPVIQMIRKAGKLASLRSKYLVPYQKQVRENNGILRYNFHQLRSDDAGTVSGRFSSTDTNVQQVMGVDRWIEAWGAAEYVIRQLFIPPPGRQWLSADAKQIEYRGFAHYANSPKINKAYEENPDLSFHKYTHEEVLRPRLPNLIYKKAKDLNFAYIYGAGLIKRAIMMGYITEAQGDEIRMEVLAQRALGNTHYRQEHHPLLKETVEIGQVYDAALPEVKPLLEKAKNLAENRGYENTILGRRSRFPLITINTPMGPKQVRVRVHKALNAVIQGTAADINKIKLKELHEARAETGFTMRMTVHDEVCGDVPDQASADKVAEILNRQSIPMRVPILWDTNVGANWGEC